MKNRVTVEFVLLVFFWTLAEGMARTEASQQTVENPALGGHQQSSTDSTERLSSVVISQAPATTFPACARDGSDTVPLLLFKDESGSEPGTIVGEVPCAAPEGDAAEVSTPLTILFVFPQSTDDDEPSTEQGQSPCAVTLGCESVPGTPLSSSPLVSYEGRVRSVSKF